MDLKKITILDHFPCCVSPRSKVISGFGLGILAFLVFLSLLLFKISFKTPLSNPFLQGFNDRFGVKNSTFIPWHFPFSSTTPAFPVNYSLNATVLGNAATSELQESSYNGSVGGGGGKGMDLAETLFSNFTGSDGDLDETLLSNSTEKLKNGSFSVVSIVVDNKALSGGDQETVKMDSHVQGDNVTVSGHGPLGECDIFDGRWIRDDDRKPFYLAGSCPYIDRDFDCHLNKRPDDGYVKWKWQPNGCDIPSLNAIDFLGRLRGKKLVFVGDSLNRNMWDSLVCILWQSIEDKKRVYETSGRREFKKEGFSAFRFEDYNCTVEFVSSPFIVRESTFSVKNGTLETLRLDLMDKATSLYRDADVLIFNTGHWWTHEKTARGEYYYQEGNHVYPKLKVLDAYTRALKTWGRWIDKNIDGSRTQVIFRGYSVAHFKRGQWNSGGQCHQETEPLLYNTRLAKYPSKMRALEHVLKDMKTPVVYLNITRLTQYRKDAHPSIYRMEYKTVEEETAAIHSQDCSHWCLPGVPDTWNELIYASLLKLSRIL